MGQAYIVAAARTAGGKRNGKLRDWYSADLGGAVLNALIDRSGADPALIEDVIFGCVTQGGEQANNIARSCVLASKLPESVPGVSVDRQCGSSQQALHFAAQAVMSGAMDIVIAGGVESMTRVPMFSNVKLYTDAGFAGVKSPGIEKRYPGIEFSQFDGAEMIAHKYGFTKNQLDEFAFDSHKKAIDAVNSNAFDAEVVPLEIVLPNGETVLHVQDEGIRKDVSLEGIQGVKLLREGGVITAANASQICDGASGVMVVNEAGLKLLGVEPIARIHQMTVVAEDPVIMLEAPLAATMRSLKRAGLNIHDIDAFEVNEAFASVPLAWLQHTGADPDRLNVNGGAIALGHPLGGSGTKLMTTLIYALKARGKRYGLQTMCEGGGLANVTIVERL